MHIFHVSSRAINQFLNNLQSRCISGAHFNTGMLSRLRRKVHDWLKDYTGLTEDNLEAIQRHYNGGARFNESLKPEDRELSREASGN